MNSLARLILCIAALGLAAFWHPAPVAANDLPVPEGPVLLTVTGAIDTTNAEDAAHFDLDMLQAVGTETFETSTIWTEGTQSFTGVPLQALMARLGVDQGTIRATAINDYAIEIPLDDPTSQAAILAFAIDGSPISRRQKGPLWLVYPFDSGTQFRSEVIYARSIWQLDRIHVLP
ncbi:hypothetical protein SAMN05421759_10769 [Roseivivax lentus]|uniref:Oxidoreductase molybdopterin-binding domain-containing protein n=1 Tax=Roseivivax lentus TaxID=633194 RepID=A0A1N7N8F0_9RHOB|nr:molybdopterin-dependent oxidoreductase [Roseivivax lentus]SIS94596.1 hypothetical protein SAMN05421759_10769 [Roseivivax lentus]